LGDQTAARSAVPELRAFGYEPVFPAALIGGQPIELLA
jgi:hypothetical protein